MTERWYIVVYGETEGPYTRRALARHPDISYDTLAKKKAEDEWKRMGDIPELKKVFEKRSKHPPKKRGREYKKEKGDTLAVHTASHHMGFWSVLIILALLYLLYRWFIR